MDSIIESLNFASRSYWGDPNKFLFYSSIENFQDNLTFDTGEDRVVKSTFNLTLNGYLIPDTEMSKIAGAAKSYGLSKVTFGVEVTDSVEASTAKTNSNRGKALNSITIGDSMNVVYNVTSGVDQNTIEYLLTNKQVIANSALTTSNTATFTGSWRVAPTGLPPTGKSNFTFFVNGNFVENTAVINFEDLGGSTCLLTVDTAILGYKLESTDVILAIGKFN
jgi:hypothetical protein